MEDIEPGMATSFYQRRLTLEDENTKTAIQPSTHNFSFLQDVQEKEEAEIEGGANQRLTQLETHDMRESPPWHY